MLFLTLKPQVSVGCRPQEERAQEVWRSGSSRQIPEVLPLKDGKIYPNAATSPFVFYGLLNYGSLRRCDVSEIKARWVLLVSAQEVVEEEEETEVAVGEVSLLEVGAGVLQGVEVAGAHPGAGVVGVEEEGDAEAWVEERKLWWSHTGMESWL